MRKSLAVLLVAALGAPATAAAQTSFGPLTSQEAGPIQRMGFTHAVEGADPVNAGVVQWESSLGYSNTFEQDSSATHDLFMDLERLSTDIGARWGATPRLEVGARLSFETTGGGILDRFISSWHGMWHMGDADRRDYPFFNYAQRLVDADGRVIVNLPKRTMALEDLRLSAKWLAWRSQDGRKLLSVSGVGRIPAERDGLGSRRADVSLSALGRASWTKWHAHAALGASTQRTSLDYDGVMRGSSLFADVAVERNLTSWLSGVVQLAAESPRLQGFDDPEIDGLPGNLIFGVSGRMGEHWSGDISFQEDIPPVAPSADFTLQIGIRRSW
jgi:hypothetical protein